MSSRKVASVVSGQETTDGGGVRLRRMIGTAELDHVDPFLLFDEFRSDRPDDYVAGFPDHPHRGFETVTYMLAGAMRHQDHKGNQGDLTAGSVQWMTAGRGIVHSEMPQQRDGLMWGFQLWVNLPASEKLAAPRYQDIPAERIPEIQPSPGVRVRVIAGESAGTRGPVEGIVTEPLYLDVSMAARTRFDHSIPAGHNAFLHVVEGDVRIGVVDEGNGKLVQAGSLAVLGNGDAVTVLTGDAPARFLLVAARPLREPIARYGPFVMNTRQQILDAFEDYRTGRFLE